MISRVGFDGVSRKTTVAPGANALSQASRSRPSISTVSIPNRGRISTMTYWQEPKRAREETILSPALSWHISAAKTAAIPLAVPRQTSAPSSRRSLSSNMATVGLA